MGSREFAFETTAECDGCGQAGAFDIYGDYLCAGCMSTGSEEVDEAYDLEERAFLREENEKLHRMLKTRDNKIKHLQEQLSQNKLRKRLDEQGKTVREQGQVIQRLKTEKTALHEYLERQNSTA